MESSECFGAKWRKLIKKHIHEKFQIIQYRHKVPKKILSKSLKDVDKIPFFNSRPQTIAQIILIINLGELVEKKYFTRYFGLAKQTVSKWKPEIEQYI